MEEYPSPEFSVSSFEKVEVMPTLFPFVGNLVVGADAVDSPLTAHSAIVVTWSVSIHTIGWPVTLLGLAYPPDLPHPFARD